MRRMVGCAVGVGIFLAPFAAKATTINVTTADTYAKIEGARAGDEVVIAPGTYKFRVFLDDKNKGTAAAPIIIRALDPKNPPVWDLSGANVEDQPGSYTAGDRGRGCWQLSGAEYVQISGLVITNCRTAGFNSAGIRYYGGAKKIVVKDVLFKDNDDGLTGGTGDSEITVEHCEFDHNGNTNASAGAPTHNIYVFGGTFALRYSYVHDPAQAQNFHIRAKSSTIENNWFARALSYSGDLMSDDEGAAGSTQEMMFRGNVVVQGDPANKGQIIAVFNDTAIANLTLKVHVIQNTFVVGFSNSNVVHLSNADGTTMSAEISNNVISNGKPFLIEDTGKGTVSGKNNWLLTGTGVAPLLGSVFGAVPPFTSAATKDFTLAPGTTGIGNADPTVPGVPDREYFQNESVTKKFRLRASALDIGAFETTTTGNGYGAYDIVPPPGSDAGSSGSNGPDGSAGSSGSSGTGGPNQGNPNYGDDTDAAGCGCTTTPVRSLAPGAIFAGLAALLWRARRRRG